MKKKRLALLLTVILMFGMTIVHIPEVKASSQVTFTKSADVCTYLSKGYNSGEKGPIIITKGVFKNKGTQTDVYLVTLSGTEEVENQATGVLEDFLSGFGQDNLYLRNTVKAITTNVPANSNLLLAGHSLGGMIAQQVAADATIKAGYNVLNTVAFGSPLISGATEGTVKRLGDVSDLIPFLSIDLIQNTFAALFGISRENGGYGSDVTAAHVDSYRSNKVWDRYDVTGTKYGSAVLTLDLNTEKFCKSPVRAE